MILDTFKIQSVVFQIRHPEAYRTWDHAGEVAQRLCQVWSDLKLVDGKPNTQSFRGKDVVIETKLTRSTVTLTGAESLADNKVQQLKETFDMLCEVLELTELTQVSTLTTFVKDFSSLLKANAELLDLNLVRWPTGKVFDQPVDSEANGIEVFYRFADEDSFSTLRMNVEKMIYEVNLDPSYVEDSNISKVRNQMLIRFDRGVLGSVNPQKFRVDDWFKGYQHILRRDIEKVIKGKL